MLHDFIWTKKYKEEMSDEHSHMLTQPRSKCFFLNKERSIGEKSQSIAVHWERRPENEADEASLSA